MAKNKQLSTVSTSRKIPATKTTLSRKAKRVLQSSGLQFFLKWAETPTTGGRRTGSGRDAMKVECSKLYKQLVAKGKKLDRKMDRPKPPPEKSEESQEQELVLWAAVCNFLGLPSAKRRFAEEKDALRDQCHALLKNPFVPPHHRDEILEILRYHDLEYPSGQKADEVEDQAAFKKESRD